MIRHFLKQPASLLKRTAALTAIAAVLFTCSDAKAQRSPRLEHKLRREVSMSWREQELAEGLKRLAMAGEITLWLDRRIDRQQRLTLQLTEVSLEQALREITSQLGLGYTRLGAVIYLGPEQSALELLTLAQQLRAKIRKLPANVSRRWLLPQATRWPRLSEPRRLAKSWLAEASLHLTGDEQIAHDLLQARSLPPLPLADRLVLLLVGFDLTCEVAGDGTECAIVPIARPLNPAMPTRESKPAAATSDNHKKTTHQVFTLSLKSQPLGRVLDQLAQQVQLQVVWKEESPQVVLEIRKRLVSCEVMNVRLEELLRSILDNTGLEFQLDGKRVILRTP